LTATAALARTVRGHRFRQNRDLNQDGIATLGELREMRGNAVFTFDTNEFGSLDARE
jgi:hypothetical protein